MMKYAVAGGTGVVGRHVVELLKQKGQEYVVLSRATGFDLLDVRGLATALGGVRAVVDVSSTHTRSAKTSTAFFAAVASNLAAAEQESGVEHHVVLSIVGAAAHPYGYYAGKARQEMMVERGTVGWSILRATQFHEFAQQMFTATRIGPVRVVPSFRMQPISARRVAERLVDLALAEPEGNVADMAGPETLSLLDMVRSYAKATGQTSERILGIRLPGALGKAMASGALTADVTAVRDDLTFAAWLAGLPAPR